MTDLWDAKLYSQFLNLRTRPARDLLSAIPDSFQPHIVYDLGCGPGNSTILLKNRWPLAKVTGIDSSLDMLKEAKASYPDIQFIQEDISDFNPAEKIDCLFANASMQWVKDHHIVIPRLLHCMNDNGMLAIQLPNNFHSPLHQTIHDILKNNVAWESLLKYVHYGKLTQPLYQASSYYNLLSKHGVTSLQLWETDYFQEMPDYQSLYEWIKGTALRPLLVNMEKNDQAKFRHDYIKALTTQYACQENNKILFSFRRLFMVGIKTS